MYVQNLPSGQVTLLDVTLSAVLAYKMIMVVSTSKACCEEQLRQCQACRMHLKTVRCFFFPAAVVVIIISSKFSISLRVLGIFNLLLVFFFFNFTNWDEASHFLCHQCNVSLGAACP